MLSQIFRSANVVLLCFSLDNRSTFDDALNRFFPEIRQESQGVVILAGLRLDLINTEHPSTSDPPSGTTVSFQEGISAAIKNAMYGYFQCSAKQAVGLDNLFVEVCRAGMFGDKKSMSTKKPGLFSFFSKRSHNKPVSTQNSHHTVDISPGTVVQTSLNVIPNNIWLFVMEYLDFPALIRVSRTCKLFYHLAKTEPMWTNAFRGVWNYPGFVKGLSWKNPSFTWDPERCFHDYVPPPPRRRRSGSDDIVCFGPNTSILLSNNKVCPMKDLAVGNQVLAFYPTYNDCGYFSLAVVHCIWKCPVHRAIPMIVIHSNSTDSATESVLEITPDHPILQLNDHCQQHPVITQITNNEHNKWCLPTALGEPQMIDVEYVYNIALQSLPPRQHTLSIIPASDSINSGTSTNDTASSGSSPHCPDNDCDGVDYDPNTQRRGGGGVVVGRWCCCTLGMSVPGYPDDWWGTDRVISWLESRPDFPNVQSHPPLHHSKKC
ncbi:hypothetical protein Pelo_11166 [Pelomyxa schiedti]|nr:hypothetical protein Pelo_11166 [Pelomyxa schiedti]